MFNKSAQGRQRVNEHHPRVNMGRVQYLLKRQDRLGSDFYEFLAECMSERLAHIDCRCNNCSPMTFSESEKVHSLRAHEEHRSIGPVKGGSCHAMPWIQF